MVKFFCLVDSPPRDPLIGDLETRQRLIEWIWDYGNQRIAGRLKYEGETSPVPEERSGLLTDLGNRKTIEDQVKGKNHANGNTFASQSPTHSPLQGTTCTVFEGEDCKAQPATERRRHGGH